MFTDGATISATNNYTVKLSTNLAPKGNVAQGWDGTSYYSTAGYKTAGWTIDNGKVTQVSATTPAFEISGLNGTPNASNITVGTNALTINDAALLKLGNDVAAAVESAATLKNGKYTTAGVKTTGYKLVDNKISYLTKNLKTITFSGLTSDATASDITVDGKTITLGKNAIPADGTAVSVKTSGYTLATDNLSEVIISDNGAAKKENYYFAADGTLPNGYVKTTGSDKKTYYVQKDAKFNQAYAEYGIKVRVVEGTTATYMTAAPSGYTKVIDANGTFYTDAITMSAALTNAAAKATRRRQFHFVRRQR